ncbi:hypothetical protein HK102_000739 [Quaeritorhiza haematococci]|nr:hypothetical protein HK102_000739 [Quaeritorhiza haematococci]
MFTIRRADHRDARQIRDLVFKDVLPQFDPRLLDAPPDPTELLKHVAGAHEQQQQQTQQNERGTGAGAGVGTNDGKQKISWRAAAREVALVENTMRARFGDVVDVETIIDTSPMSVVGVEISKSQKDDEEMTERVVGFLALSNQLPERKLKIGDQKGGPGCDDGRGPGGLGEPETGVDVGKWMRTWYECPDMEVNATYVPDQPSLFLNNALRSVFAALPHLRDIVYLTTPEQPLSHGLSSKTEQKKSTSEDDGEPKGLEYGALRRQPRNKKQRKNRVTTEGKRNVRTAGRRRHGVAKDGGEGFAQRVCFKEIPAKAGVEATYSLHMCKRSSAVPTVRIRKARVEDCDDVVPMFKKQNILQNTQGDFHLADLLESSSESVKTLVAEADGDVVGFMSVTLDINYDVLLADYVLEPYDNLLTEKIEEPTRPKIDNILSAEEALAFGSLPAAVAAAATAAPKPPKLVPNAFCIQLFCMEDAYANQAAELVRHAFGLFPDQDFCVLTVPTTVPEIPLLQTFSEIPHKPGRSTDNCLYLVDRSCVTEPVSVHSLQSADVDGIKELVSGLTNEKDVMAVVETVLWRRNGGSGGNNDGSVESLANLLGATDGFKKEEGVGGGIGATLKAFTIKHTAQVVGLIVIERLGDIGKLVDQFDVEEHMGPVRSSADPAATMQQNHKYYALHHIVINPLFEPQARFVLQEVSRIANAMAIFYPMDLKRCTNIATCKIARKEMCPVRPRRRVQYPNDLRDDEPVPPPFDFNLLILTSAALYEPKITVNTRICVIGGSDVGISFLESLVYNPHLNFTNLTLISSDGFLVPDDAAEMFVSHRCYTGIELKQLGLEQFVNMVKASTTEFDRGEKKIWLNTGGCLLYDYLILTPGVQFHAAHVSTDFASLHGVYGVTKAEAPQVYRAIEAFVQENDEKALAVVYGRHMQAYASVQALVKRNVPPKKIVLVVPRPKTPSSCFNNPVVERKVHEMLEKLGVTVHLNYKLASWESEHQCITKATFKSQTDGAVPAISLQGVEIFLYADEKTVDLDTFASINDSCLVFDGRLVIDKYFRTQDPNIYAAGSISKYSSIYQTNWSQHYYDSREVGTKVAETLLPFFDPLCLPQPLKDPHKLLEYTAAKKVQALLPGNLNYFHFDRPRLPSHTLEYRRKQSEYGRDLIIDKPNTVDYCRIHVDKYGYIVSFTYVGDRKIPMGNLSCLYGMHERYLNRLVSRFDEGIIEDFICFLNEPWALSIFNDRFGEFVQHSRIEMLLHDDDEAEIQQIIQKLTDLGKDGKLISTEDREALYSQFDKLTERLRWDKDVFQYLLDTKLFRSYP